MTLFEEAEQDPIMPDEAFGHAEPELRDALLAAQAAWYRRADRALLVVVAGIDGAGKGSAINLLNEWLNPRTVRTLAFGEPTGDEALRPPMWRYWNELPARGHIGIVFGSWYTALVREAARKRPDRERLAQMTAQVQRFETMLAAEGVQLLKLWYHLSRDAQRRRCEVLASDPDTAWRVSKEDLRVRKRYGRLRRSAIDTVSGTDFPFAPWTIVPSADPGLRAFRTAVAVRDALRRRAPARPPQPPLDSTPVPPLLGELDYAVALSRDDYETALTHWQGRLSRAVHHKRFADRSLVVVFEGNDAAGKGGAIRRLAHALDIRQTRINATAAPGEAALARPYLWRFWRDVPPRGRIAIFDRSWYGRVLVERVEHLARPAQWRRAYGEIVEFEHELAAHGAIVVKCWLAITKDEQLARFEARENTPFKRYKITDDDWRNRGQWDAYRHAAEEMFARTGTPVAPWDVVPANDKRHARVSVVRIVALAVERALGLDGKAG